MMSRQVGVLATGLILATLLGLCSGYAGMVQAREPGEPAGEQPQSAPGSPNSGDADRDLLAESITRLIELHNEVRSKADTGLLEAEPRLTAAARRHAEDMAQNERLDHKGKDGSTMVERVRDEGYRFRFLGENIAYGMRTPEHALKQWLNSPPHKKNILNGDFREIGAAAVRSKGGKVYWCVVFGKPLEVSRTTRRSSPR
jgi:uncharacterized protein YkwD